MNIYDLVNIHEPREGEARLYTRAAFMALCILIIYAFLAPDESLRGKSSRRACVRPNSGVTTWPRLSSGADTYTAQIEIAN